MDSVRLIVLKLNAILKSNYDAVEGYKNAAHHAEDDKLKTMFREHAEQRGKFASDLSIEIEDFGEEPAHGGTLAGNMHRVWMDFKSVFSTGNDETILEECLRGERASLIEYEELLNVTEIPQGVKTLIALQKSIVTDYVSELEAIERDGTTEV